MTKPFLDEASDQRPVEYFQSLEKFREPGLPCKLSAHLVETLKTDAGLVELKRKVQVLKEKDGLGSALTDVNQLKSYQKTLFRTALSRYQNKWVQDRRDWKILTRGKIQPRGIYKTDLVENLCLLIPERGRLAPLVDTDEPLSPAAMWHAMQDMLSLCLRDLSVLYLPRLEPFEDACPVKCCRQKMTR